jgi:oligopeptide transport system substrate-binding protein
MKFRKFLASISAFSAVILSGASVVSCGPITFQKLMTRKVDTQTFYGELKAPVDNWSTATTMESQNNTHTANLVDA